MERIADYIRDELYQSMTDEQKELFDAYQVVMVSITNPSHPSLSKTDVLREVWGNLGLSHPMLS